jgi:hypothetical protein
VTSTRVTFWYAGASEAERQTSRGDRPYRAQAAPDSLRYLPPAMTRHDPSE